LSVLVSDLCLDGFMAMVPLDKILKYGNIKKYVKSHLFSPDAGLLPDGVFLWGTASSHSLGSPGLDERGRG